MRKVKFTRPGAVKTCPRCGRKEKPSDEEDDIPTCPGQGDPKKCEEVDTGSPPDPEDVWNFWRQRASQTRLNVQSTIQSQITADTIEVFNIHVQATKEQLKNWLDDKGIVLPLAHFKNDQNPRKKTIADLSQEVIFRILDFNGSFMEYLDGTKSRLYLTAYKAEDISPTSTSSSTSNFCHSLSSNCTSAIICIVLFSFGSEKVLEVLAFANKSSSL